MKKTKRIAAKNYPARLPLFQTITYIMAIDYYQLSPFIVGAVGALVGLYWIQFLLKLFNSEPIDLFEEEQPK